MIDLSSTLMHLSIMKLVLAVISLKAGFVLILTT